MKLFYFAAAFSGALLALLLISRYNFGEVPFYAIKAESTLRRAVRGLRFNQSALPDLPR